MAPLVLVLSALEAVLPGMPDRSRTATADTRQVVKLIRSLKWNAGHSERFPLTGEDRKVEWLKLREASGYCV